jgi:hypothetical protein
MRRPQPAILRECDARILSLCETHLAREEALLADMLRTLREIRAAFVQRNLNGLAALQTHQEQLAQTGQEMGRSRDQLRESLAPLLGVPASEVTLRAAALSLPEAVRGSLLDRHAHLVELVRQADQLNHHNAALLGYARSFLRGLFASLTGTSVSEGYGPQGERRAELCGSFLEARV